MKKSTLEKNFKVIREVWAGTMMSDGKRTIYRRIVGDNIYVRRISRNGRVYDEKVV